MIQQTSEAQVPGLWGRFTHWVNHYRAITRLVSLTATLGIILIFLPPYLRIVLWESLLSHKILASMLLIFSILAVSLVWSTGQFLDGWAFMFINLRGPRPNWLDRIMLGFTQIGSGVATLVIALVLFLFFDRLLSYEFILGSLSLWLLVELLKFLIQRSRPFARLAQTRIVGYRAIGRSFPSGHTSQVFFIATLFSHQFKLGVVGAVALYLIAVLVGFTRIYVGAHYPRDIIAGALLGSIWGVMATLMDPYWFGV
jgi:membrane-associated phospholipid phosphatase